MSRPLSGRDAEVRDIGFNTLSVAGAYHAGKFLNASFDKASDENERQSFKIRTAGGAIGKNVSRRRVLRLHAGERKQSHTDRHQGDQATF